MKKESELLQHDTIGVNSGQSKVVSGRDTNNIQNKGAMQSDFVCGRDVNNTQKTKNKGTMQTGITSGRDTNNFQISNNKTTSGRDSFLVNGTLNLFQLPDSNKEQNIIQLKDEIIKEKDERIIELSRNVNLLLMMIEQKDKLLFELQCAQLGANPIVNVLQEFINER